MCVVHVFVCVYVCMYLFVVCRCARHSKYRMFSYRTFSYEITKYAFESLFFSTCANINDAFQPVQL